jgi:hypothetical protein
MRYAWQDSRVAIPIWRPPLRIYTMFDYFRTLMSLEYNIEMMKHYIARTEYLRHHARYYTKDGRIWKVTCRSDDGNLLWLNDYPRSRWMEGYRVEELEPASRWQMFLLDYEQFPPKNKET